MITGRLKALEKKAHRTSPEQCLGPATVVVVGEEEVIGGAPCSLCGEPHIIRIIEEIVEARPSGGSSLA